jgi:hypothetical protein
MAAFADEKRQGLFMDHTWTCRCCGKQFSGLPLDHAFTAPDQWYGRPEAEPEGHSKLDPDLCVIAQQDHFVRGCLEIPILGREEKFVWGVWASVSERSFRRVLELWEASSLDDEPPLFGWFCNTIKIYPPTLGLKTSLYLRAGGIRPAIELEPTDHPLAVEQRHGISLQRVEELAAALMPRH